MFGGRMKPISLAVFKLITNSNFAGCSTGITQAGEKNAYPRDLGWLLRLNHRSYNHHRANRKKVDKSFHRAFRPSAEH
jgi:hypothetical protein